MKVEMSNPEVKSIKVSIAPPDSANWGLLFDGDLVPFPVIKEAIDGALDSNPSFKSWLARAHVVKGFNPGAKRLSLELKDHGVDLQGMIAVGTFELGAEDFVRMVWNTIYHCDLAPNIEADPRMPLICKAKH